MADESTEKLPGQIFRPEPYSFGEAASVHGFLKLLDDWERNNSSSRGYHGRVWYRGHSKVYDRAGGEPYQLVPGVYREKFTQQARDRYQDETLEEKRRKLECEMLGDFQSAGATHFDFAPDGFVRLYFIAQHHEMPTRLLDWTTNPLAALFFAVEKEPAEDGEVLVMDAKALIPPEEEVKKLLPPDYPESRRAEFPLDVLSMRHPYVRYAVGLSFWSRPEPTQRPPLILPVRPDSRLGRITQQSSCFTLHMHESESRRNQTLASIKIPGRNNTKETLRTELHRLHVNQFTIYNDLDHLSRAIKGAWGLVP